ncbi:hypothetical protein [Bartonella tribocorum]|uniref:hypothetical protein n=1 Tax=Bartonella tribocorum TaxID=85701 RepID=UPI001FEDCACE|nr:hypothetical protein [Bartonella tribocorum]
MQLGGNLFYVKGEGCDSIEERDKQKRKVISDLYYLKDIFLKTFASLKAELKGDDKDGS